MDQFDQIEAWLEGELSAENAREFAGRLKEDPELAAAVKRHRMARRLLEAGVSEQLKEDIARISAESSTRLIRPSWTQWSRYGLVAATLLILIGWAGWHYWTYTGSRINAAAFNAYPASGLRQGAKTGREDRLAAYAAQDYATALEQLSALPDSSPDYIQARFLMGVSQLALGTPDAALLSFLEVYGADDPRFRQAAEWYMVLALAGTGQWDSAQTAARQLSNAPDHPYRLQASDWLRKTQSFWFHR